MADETDRRPSFGYDRGGKPFVRGFRSKRGSPQADTTQNIGAIDVGRSTLAGSSQEDWDQKFRNRVTGETPSSLAAQRAGGAVSTPPANVGAALDEVQRSQFGFDQQPFKMSLGGPPPTLATPTASPSTAFTPPRTLAPIGQNPATPTMRKFKMFGSNAEDTFVPGIGTKRVVKSPYGWGSSYLPT